MFGLRKLYFATVRLPIRWLVRVKILPDSPVNDLNIDTTKPIYYVLRTRSTSSFNMLEQECEKLGLPNPRFIPSGEKDIPNGGVLFIQHKQIFGRKPSTIKKYSELLQTILKQHFELSNDSQLIPVSIYWGRNPGKEKSIFRLLLTDTESANPLRKFLIILFQGRNSFLRFGSPLQLNRVKPNVNYSNVAQKVSRIFRVYFHRQWIAAMGPLISSRKQMITGLLANDDVITLIKREQKKKNISYEKSRKVAIKYAEEIMSNYSYSTVRLMSRLLTYVWNKLYDGIKVINAERVRQIANDHEIVYVPCHRSHIDYLLLSYVLYYEGLVPPHIAAGINLNFWPVGSLLRGGGAFFLRRSFRGNKLYTAVFNSYLHLLLDKGIPVEFFPEGGRSRTGRLLQPKTGMMAMTIQSFLKGCRKPIMIVPVYIGYERMMEGKSYVSEMQGGAKKKESMGELLKVRNQLKSRYGKVYVNFAEPIKLEDYIEEHVPNWRETKDNDRPEWLSDVVTKISDETMVRINSNVAVNSVNLVSLILLSTQRHTLGKKELILQIELYLSLLKEKPYHKDTYCPDESAEDLLKQATALNSLNEFENPLGNLCQLPEKSAVLLTYYRNNIIHLFAMPALIASCFRQHSSRKIKELTASCKAVYPLLKTELFLPYQSVELDELVEQYVTLFCEKGLLTQIDDTVLRPNIDSESYAQLMLLADTLRDTFERFGITLTLLSAHAGKGSISRTQLETQSQKLAQRISALYNIYAPESFDKSLFQQIVGSLRRAEFIDSKDGSLVISAKIPDLNQLVLSLLSQSSQESLSKTARWAVERWREEQ